VDSVLEKSNHLPKKNEVMLSAFTKLPAYALYVEGTAKKKSFTSSTCDDAKLAGIDKSIVK